VRNPVGCQFDGGRTLWTICRSGPSGSPRRSLGSLRGWRSCLLQRSRGYFARCGRARRRRPSPNPSRRTKSQSAPEGDAGRDAVLTAAVLGSRKSNSESGPPVSSPPRWVIWFIVAAAAILSPVLAFLMAIAVEIVVGVLNDAGKLKSVALVAAGAMGWSWCRKVWVRARGRATVET
jgi:hypothetical protein